MERPLTQYFKPDQTPIALKEYLSLGGYQSAQKARSMAPDDLIKMVKESNLMGRGGAGFLTGLKWSLVPKGDGPRYVVCNADEMEPGTFKDRFLLENHPHQLLEGVLIASHAIGAKTAYIFIRGDYIKPIRLVEEAIREAEAAGIIGKSSEHGLEIHTHVSAGRYMCGEETALLNSLEGKRANPRSKPPFPVVSGLWGRPTVINNVETLSNLPHIVRHGAQWFKDISLTGEGGTKLYGVSGHVKRPGCWELPLGTPLREVLLNHAGGMMDGYQLRGIIPGGASTDFLTEAHLDVPMDFASVQKAGSRLGTATMIILDDKTCPIGFLKNIIGFFARESCGWCTPCREGLPWLFQILGAIEDGKGTEEDIAILEEHTTLLGPGNTFCALAPGAMEPLQSGLKIFKDEFIEHVRTGKCRLKPESEQSG